tara:strand:- start:54 stop:1136 length:1083 start_codon:yes stop_codon:yes gene_type:complete
MKQNQTKIFKRYLKQEFIEALNKQSWWSRIVNDPDLFIGIRDNYLNVYFHGNSLVKLSPSRGGKIRGETHKAYLKCVKPQTQNRVISEDGKFEEPVSPRLLSEIEVIKAQANAHFGIASTKAHQTRTREKSAIQEFLRNQENIIDVEVAVSTKRSAEPLLDIKRSIPRIDLVQLQQTEDGFRLSFIEVKYVNNKELCSRKEPRVVAQLIDYQNLLAVENIRKEIIFSYGKVIENLANLGVAGTKPMPLVRDFVSNPNVRLWVNPRPKLLVLWRNDVELEKVPKWLEHKEKLEEILDTKKIDFDFKKNLKWKALPSISNGIWLKTTTWKAWRPNRPIYRRLILPHLKTFHTKTVDPSSVTS